MQRDDFNGLVHVADSVIAERSWFFRKVGIETVLLGNWYRPGSSEYDGHAELYEELTTYFVQVSGILLIGDLNSHHKRWLQYS